ncbi:MAG: nucleotidyltransferase substrate binding protein [Campylobacterales bacterium]
MENRWKQRFASYKKALAALESGIASTQTPTMLEKDGVIQRFEFTFELAWKTLQDYLTNQGYLDIGGPRNTLRQAFADGILENGDEWMAILEDRNLMTHTYDEATSERVFERILQTYLPLLQQLSQRLGQLL